MTSRLAAFLGVSALALACASAPAPRQEPKEEPQGLTYKEYTLGAPAPDALLVALHYSGSTPEFWDELLNDWGAAVRVVLPRGPRPHREGFTWFPVDHEQKEKTAKTADVEIMTDRIARIIREIRLAHPEIRHVAVTGFSYGGDLAWALAIRYPELVDVAVPMGSRLLGDPARPLPETSRVLVLQGEVDPIIDARQTAQRVTELKARGVPIDVRIYADLGHDVSPQLIEDWRTFLRQELRGTTESREPAGTTLTPSPF